ncbi:hypothetical protein TCAL_02091 [Tigriopus californicus]|uniref:Protein lin-52 homolog n=1 Tax=Tigriopus californicus TaxID=6832 RepID=A0A553NEG7_TIGCA|nr:protein lin-52 homolog [Tigriopus californicus]TRY63798.1 hypothetical protein TCAL_02091 [Tigriopus californicus]|eukprot:TCALIF_02091-PA protein Name:"Similar to lin52 Protein lin-52 homolog (Danio rerio)" AED:0.07 eAED:0.07 QI:175/1/1/1/1/1/4/95/181
MATPISLSLSASPRRNLNACLDLEPSQDSTAAIGGSTSETASTDATPHRLASNQAHESDQAGPIADTLEADLDPPLQDLEDNLLALEKLDRASPDLWPDHIPGVSQFVPLETSNDSPANNANVLTDLSNEDLSTIYQLGNLPVAPLLNEVKRLHDIAYELGIEERKEMTRGKYLNILKRRC